jgi:acyl carrier protein phosphodiesterase
MNFLAHVFLAGPLAADRVGGIIGDFVKGPLDPLPPGLSPQLAAGVMLHRRIDSHAETHPAFRRSRARVSTARRRVSGIMVDLFYDHFLARHWTHFSTWLQDAPPALSTFTADTYRLIAHYPEPLPPAFAPVFERMAAHDWMSGYRDLERIALALDRMAEFRLRRPNPLAGSGEELVAEYAGYEADCFEFLTDAWAHAASVRQGRG